MRETTPPRHDLLDFQGDAKYSTSTRYYVEPRGIGVYGIVAIPKVNLTREQLQTLKQVYYVFDDLPVTVSENGVITVEVPAGTKIGWILSRLAIFYRLSLARRTP